MNILKRLFTKILPVVIFVSSLAFSAHGAPLDKIKIVKIASADESAVVKIPGARKLKLVKVGDNLGDKGGLIKEISKGRLVIEEGEGDKKETIIITVGKGKQRVERIRRKKD